MKRLLCLLLVCVMLMGLTACGAKDSGGDQDGEMTWESQYDLGMRLLNEGKYEEAILAFAAAIRIDPKRAEAYVARGDAYVQLGRWAEAEKDYEKALEIKEDIEVINKLFDVQVALGKIDGTKVDGPENEETSGETETPEMTEAPEEPTLFDPIAEMPPIPDNGGGKEVVEVNTGEELEQLFFDGTVKDKEIHLGDGEYVIGSIWLWEAENVSIIGTGKTRVVSNYGEETIISMFNCKNILLYGLVMGHEVEPEVYCSMGVVEVIMSQNVNIVGCDIYGCGVQGVNIDRSEATVERTIIRDCSEYGALVGDSQVVFRECLFSGNCYKIHENPLFVVGGDSNSVTLESCVLRDNYSQQRYRVNYGNTNWVENGTIETGNGWQ